MIAHGRKPDQIRLLYAARGMRGFGDGFAVIMLPAYLAEIGFDPVQIGIVATAALLGTALLTLRRRPDRAAPRPAQAAAARRRLMVATGIAFP